MINISSKTKERFVKDVQLFLNKEITFTEFTNKFEKYSDEIYRPIFEDYFSKFASIDEITLGKPEGDKYDIYRFRYPFLP